MPNNPETSRQARQAHVLVDRPVLLLARCAAIVNADVVFLATPAHPQFADALDTKALCARISNLKSRRKNGRLVQKHWEVVVHMAHFQFGQVHVASFLQHKQRLWVRQVHAVEVRHACVHEHVEPIGHRRHASPVGLEDLDQVRAAKLAAAVRNT